MKSFGRSVRRACPFAVLRLEYQLADDANADAASDPRRVAGSLYSVIAPVPKVPPKIGEFNHSRIVVRGTHVEHWLTA